METPNPRKAQMFLDFVTDVYERAKENDALHTIHRVGASVAIEKVLPLYKKPLNILALGDPAGKTDCALFEGWKVSPQYEAVSDTHRIEFHGSIVRILNTNGLVLGRRTLKTIEEFIIFCNNEEVPLTWNEVTFNTFFL